jgi:hypothetical protein
LCVFLLKFFYYCHQLVRPLGGSCGAAEENIKRVNKNVFLEENISLQVIFVCSLLWRLKNGQKQIKKNEFVVCSSGLAVEILKERGTITTRSTTIAAHGYTKSTLHISSLF